MRSQIIYHPTMPGVYALHLMVLQELQVCDCGQFHEDYTLAPICLN